MNQIITFSAMLAASLLAHASAQANPLQFQTGAVPNATYAAPSSMPHASPPHGLPLGTAKPRYVQHRPIFVPRYFPRSHARPYAAPYYQRRPRCHSRHWRPHYDYPRGSHIGLGFSF